MGVIGHNSLKDWLLCHLVSFQVITLIVVGVCVFYPLEKKADAQLEDMVQVDNTVAAEIALPENKEAPVFKEIDKPEHQPVEPMPMSEKKVKEVYASEVEIMPGPKHELNDSSLNPQELRLQEARKAFWMKDIRRSIKAYHQYIEFYPLQDSVYVELENVYRSVGQQTQMIPMYQEAIVLFQEAGQIEKSLKLQALLDGLDK